MKKKIENKPFDKILKENIEEIFLKLSEQFFGIKIKKTTIIEEKLQRTIEREPDFLRFVEDESGEKYILHLEFHVKDEPEIAYRMQEYCAFLLRKFKINVFQHVLYLGKDTPILMKKIPESHQMRDFNLVCIHQFSYKEFINSQVPEEVILAILADFEGEKPDLIVRFILLQLKKICKNEITLRKFVTQLNLLSRLRKLEPETSNQIENMPITYDIETDALYLKGIEKGIERGIEKGIEKEREQKQKEKDISILEMLESGILTIEQIAKFTHVSTDYVLDLRLKNENNK